MGEDGVPIGAPWHPGRGRQRGAFFLLTTIRLRNRGSADLRRRAAILRQFCATILGCSSEYAFELCWPPRFRRRLSFASRSRSGPTFSTAGRLGLRELTSGSLAARGLPSILSSRQTA